ncbi:hypothetical protein N7454_003480 [Penicillium verhagenii]|nr:hypothetical protein N7454_003480 [Penicillium verhagenii]
MISAKHGFALVTPASRGLGFAFAQQLLAKTKLPVVATARRDCTEVRDQLLSSKGLSKDAEKRLRVLKLDVTDETTISSMADTIRQEYPATPLRIALTIPGILHVEKSPAQIDAESALHSFQVNAVGPLLLMKHLAPFLPARSSDPFPTFEDADEDPEKALQLPSHAIYAMMAARVGSVSDNNSGGWYSYRASKAAVFQIAKTFDLYLRGKCRDRALAVALHPGTVYTEFTKEFWTGREMLEPLESADLLLRFLTQLPPGNEDGRGRCWDWKGKEILP